MVLDGGPTTLGIESTVVDLTGEVPELLRPALAVWTGLVLLFLFIPIFLVIRHSFNDGPSFSVWSGDRKSVV